MKERVLSIDIIKFLSIVGVLLIHILGSKSMYGGVFWYAQAVPLFMIIMGYNSKLSFPSMKKMVLVFTPYILTYIISLSYVIFIAYKSGSGGGIIMLFIFYQLVSYQREALENIGFHCFL